MTRSRAMFGRRVIYTDADKIGSSNVIAVLTDALNDHRFNSGNIQYLYDYYKGNQPVLSRKKEIRSEINNKIVENRANEIVSFKVGYLMGEPVQYVSRGGEEKNTDAINLLNEYMFAEDKATKDKELADWFSICGTAYRMVLPDPRNERDDSPFEIYTLDPRYSFVVYSSGLGNKPMMGVKYIVKENSDIVYSVYTDNMYFEIVNGIKITKEAGHSLSCVPIVEYPANSARLGAFEVVLPLLDAINEVSSNRLDGVEQFIQSLLMFKGVDLSSEEFDVLREKGGIKVPLDGDVKYLTSELNQSQTQTLTDHLYQTVLTICGMPNRNGGKSTSDTGSAVIMRDGWYAAEARAKDTELMFKQSEKKFLRIALQIANTLRDQNLKLSSVEIRFTRRNYENIQEKAQVLTTMLANDKIHPLLAFTHSGLFSDPNVAYAESMRYFEEMQRKLEQELAEINPPREVIASV